jgi:uncharacterized membrane protein HdeD (DUF308 family)
VGPFSGLLAASDGRILNRSPTLCAKAQTPSIAFTGAALASGIPANADRALASTSIASAPAEMQRDRTMTISLEEAAQVLRDGMRDAVRRHSLGYFTQSFLMTLAGLLALVYPIFSSAEIITILGWLLIICGLLQAIGLIGSRHLPHFWLQAFSMVLFVVVGLLTLRHGSGSLFALTLLLVVFFAIEGFSRIIFALWIRPFPHWVWILTSGVVAIALAFYLWANLLRATPLLLAVLLGIALICEGVAVGLLAWGARRTGGGLTPFRTGNRRSP